MDGFFDEVTVKASHIVLRLPAGASEKEKAEAHAKLTQIRSELANNPKADFAELARKQAEESGARGIYVWMSKSPSRVEVVMMPGAAEEKFTPRSQKYIRDLLARRFELSRDRQLLRAVAYVEDTLDYAGRPVVWPWVLGLVAVVLAGWGGLLLLRARDRDKLGSTGSGGRSRSSYRHPWPRRIRQACRTIQSHDRTVAGDHGFAGSAGGE